MDKHKLFGEYNHRIGLHAHSMPASNCCNCPMGRFLGLYAERGVEAVCLTNHFFKDRLREIANGFNVKYREDFLD